MFRWLRTKREQELETALRFERAAREALERKITVHIQEKNVLRTSLLHWRTLYHDLQVAVEEQRALEKPE